MKRNIIGVFSCFLALSALYFFVAQVQAGSFSTAYVRLDRTKASTATTGLVCALTPSSDNGVEASVQVVLPAGFTVGSMGNWAVATDELPSGATAWPGIGSATNVSGQTVTFPSSNLSVSTLYCFRWTSSAALTNPAAQTSESGTVRTQTAGAVTIDTKDYALPTSSDQVGVTAAVPFASTDFSADVTTTTTGQPYPQSTDVTIQVDYTSNISYATPMTIEAIWSLGTISGNGSPTVEVVDYVVGSASNAYGGAAPVIEIVNRKISWSISSFPAGQAASVTFKLRTNSNYTGSQQVAFNVEGRVLAQSVQSASDTLDLTYKYVVTITPTPTPGPTNSPTPGPAPTSSVTSNPTPTPTVTPALPFAFKTINVSQISADLIGFLISTTQNSTVNIRFGTSPNKLTETIRDTSNKTAHSISISPLSADTVYYFRIEATNNSGRVIKSDIYLVTTARISTLTAVDTSSLIVVSNNVILLQNAMNRNNTVVIPKDTPFSFRFSFREKLAVQEMRISVRNKKVLGLFDVFGASPQPREGATTIVETSPGVYNGLLKTSPAVGHYDVTLRVRDENGNLGDQNLFDVKVTEPMKVIDERSKEPIQGAYVELFIFSPTEQDYVPITADMFPLSDSEFTDQNGEASYVLPSARYLARISAPGYDKKEVEFTIGPNKNEELPTVLLKGARFNIFNIATYYGAIIWRECQTAANSLQQLAASNNLFGFTAFFAMISFVILTLLSFGRRLKIPLSHMHLYFHHVIAKSPKSNMPSHPNTTQLVEKEFIDVVFEYLLVSSFLLEIFFTAVFGLPKTAPFLALSLINLFLWVAHLVHKDRV